MDFLLEKQKIFMKEINRQIEDNPAINSKIKCFFLNVSPL